ncbi:putative AP-5 complex subunit beta-1 protein [Dioscorea sansibarensis]
MEKQSSPKPPPPPPPLVSPQDFELLADDFSSCVASRRLRWLPLPLLDLTLAAILRRDFPVSVKPLLLLFLEDSASLVFLSPSSLPPLLDSLRSFLLSADPPPPLKDQFVASATTILITTLPSPLDPSSVGPLESLISILLAIVHRPNHGPDRQSRAGAAECLRELELAFPLLLSTVAGHLWSLAQSERTHASQSYALLLASTLLHIVQSPLISSPHPLFSTSLPLLPFNIPQSVFSLADDDRDPTELNLREIRRVLAFLLDRTPALTPCALAEMVSALLGIVDALERRVPAVTALLKVRFSGLIYSYDPVLVHVVLTLYARFSDAFTGEDELAIARRLVLLSKDAQMPLVFRLLALHWLLGSKHLVDERVSLSELAPCFYPLVFDPLALKAKKLDALACIAARKEVSGGGGESEVVKLFEDGLVCVSAFKWLPPSSSETSMAFRAFHEFLIAVAPAAISDSTIFRFLKGMFVKLVLEHPQLVPVIAAFVDRLWECNVHRRVGEWLLQTFDEQLLPKLKPGYQLVSCFPIFERIAESDSIPPRGLLELLTRHVVYLTEKHGPATGLRSWSQGSKVLGICRMMLMHHHSSRVFHGLSRLLGFTCQFFPELEVRDNARIYLRMLVCIPGKKLRHILSLGEQTPGVSPSTNSSSFFQVPSPRHSQDLKKISGVTSFIHLNRVTPLLVKQSWSLALPSLSTTTNEIGYSEGIRDIVPTSAQSSKESEVDVEKISLPSEPLRVMDSKVAEIVGILRRHFAWIPDYRHMPGIKIMIPCTLSFEAEPFSRIWGIDSSDLGLNGVEGLPALYATTLAFSSTSKYGSIPPCRIPFLLGQPSKAGFDIVPIESGFEKDSSFQASVTIELEPREPMPGLIDVAIKANVDNGQVISGSLQCISVGLEDMFLKAIAPPDISKDELPVYYFDLFHALWEACGNSANTGRETFRLSGGKGAAAISGTRSVKLLEEHPNSLINAVEKHLAPFVVGVIGDTLVNTIKLNGIVRDVVWIEDSSEFTVTDANALVPYSDKQTLQLEYTQDEHDSVSLHSIISKKSMGIVLILIFLPPRFHLLFQMEIGNVSALVRIRTDHWPCLAYVDEFLESLFSS